MQSNSIESNKPESTSSNPQGVELMLRLAPDNRATREDLIAHAAAINEYRLGETVSDKEIDWD